MQFESKPFQMIAEAPIAPSGTQDHELILINYDLAASGTRSFCDSEYAEKIYIRLLLAAGNFDAIAKYMNFSEGLVLIEADKSDLELETTKLKKSPKDRRAGAEFDLIYLPRENGKYMFDEAVNIEAKLIRAPQDIVAAGHRRRKKRKTLCEQLQLGIRLFRRTYGLLMVAGEMWDAFNAEGSEQFSECRARITTAVPDAGMLSCVVGNIPGTPERQALAFDNVPLFSEAQRMGDCEIAPALYRFARKWAINDIDPSGMWFAMRCHVSGCSKEFRFFRSHQLKEARCHHCATEFLEAK